MFHMAYLIGSQIAVNMVLKNPFETNDTMDPAQVLQIQSSEDVLFQLNLAHILTPIFTGLSLIANNKGYNVLEKIFDTISIFQY